MDRLWLLPGIAVSVSEIDFEDPAEIGMPNLRERGVRVELRAADAQRKGSIYASSQLDVAPAFCRIDLLESAPYAADRMHWHPVMTDGEPGDRVFDTAIPGDPIAWLTGFLENPRVPLEAAGASLSPSIGAALEQLRPHGEEITDCVASGLARSRQPWPHDVVRDETGLA